MPRATHRQANPIQTAVQRWIAALPQHDNVLTQLRARTSSHSDSDGDGEEWGKRLMDAAPKRWTIYEPMALLPSGSFTNEPWASLMERPDEVHLGHLWSLILQELSLAHKSAVTHLAINQGIPLHQDGQAAGDKGKEAGEGEQCKKLNVRRSPSSLRILQGDFGPGDVRDEPMGEDFERAFWVATKQNGIRQTWAPRWTMFSRGNIKEKARVLAFGKKKPGVGIGVRAGIQGHGHDQAHRGSEGSEGSEGSTGSEGVSETWAVDLYAGIGYFTFSYAALGMRVLCWEINPWSVEALRRGASLNGWSVRVVQGRDLNPDTDTDMDTDMNKDIDTDKNKDMDMKLEGPLGELPVAAGGPQIIVFLESNERAAARIRRLQEDRGVARRIAHVNCGFLPTSEPMWRPAWEMTRRSAEAWLHLHENVGVADLETRRRSIQGMFDGWAASSEEGTWREPTAERVEQVKTFAPGVWHCVYDVRIVRRKPVKVSSDLID